MNLLRRLFAKTPGRNKRIGRALTTVSGMLTSVEVVLIAYSVPVPQIIHNAIIGTAIITALWAGYHGQKVKR